MNGFGGIGGWEIVMLAVIVMVVLGPERMVKHAFKIGRWARQFSSYWQEGTRAFREQMRDFEDDAKHAVELPHVEAIKDMASELSSLNGLENTPEGIQETESTEGRDRNHANAANYSAWTTPDKPPR